MTLLRRIANTAEVAMLGGYTLKSPPRMHHRNPSITATIGFSEYNSLYCSGTTLVTKPTGEI